ncbi:thiamine pyrophosphate-binding protein [Tuwongella immobilis]|uniref:Benzoylformate decarboxylase n=1 Tax=Tuwongella immobilis TaxID=692036 RepID=A0A6C2YI16_9BACT|nr:thiamine pyrophosphate-binding protein [Tuwongella immobilis]VIP00705.1 benzoylformate decarboxylase : Thiamine pyrophosphate protein TPP binding domain protein OS=Pirellula staleyi (strain ATCC 27377 / DSM 6068 / ICPB 4128) GN=Psta_0577 PE=3 SV=1: TPP_enzyme_N: TPP_enzyme_M: TPP_enzyme_C [Tuwongella immobilis]VTR96828.1 benzoylformate decarboxylase : Thiamine pyrophosphate protein TPP binding domain protein OS=Pirellula staleyi (strain ATCC 27377 / DSM 6068 / ICPB 4128) GN=Psta_0577 PE=3 SV=1
MQTTGIGSFLEVLHRSGISMVFGNPGTTELPLNDAISGDSRFRYILGIHEVPVMAMADGYAMASGMPGVVNLHTACGLGNAMGMLFNAMQSGTPLVVTAGQQDHRLLFDEPVLAGELVDVAKPWTKWAIEVPRAADMPNAIRRAIQIAMTPPMGPVFLSLPLNVQSDAIADADVSGAWLPDVRLAPSVARIQQAAQTILRAKNPLILAGSRVTEAGACEVLGQFAEVIGAPVLAECNTSHGRLPIAANHPLYAGPAPIWSPDVRQRLADHDLLIVVGMNLLRLYIHAEPSRPIPEGMPIVHLDSNPAEIGKNFPVEVGLWGDPRTGLEMLIAELAPRLSRELVQERRTRHEAAIAQQGTEFRGMLETHRDDSPMSPWTMMHAIAQVLPGDAAVIHEAPTGHRNVLEKLGVFRDPSGFFAPRGWALGWGVGAAVGVKLAWPHRPTVAILGDGSAMYGIQGLWSAAREQLPIVFIIGNNRQYRILRDCGVMLKLDKLASPNCPGMDLNAPNIDFVGLAQSLGVSACRVNSPSELQARLSAGLSGNSPLVIEVPLSE